MTRPSKKNKNQKSNWFFLLFLLTFFLHACGGDIPFSLVDDEPTVPVQGGTNPQVPVDDSKECKVPMKATLQMNTRAPGKAEEKGDVRELKDPIIVRFDGSGKVRLKGDEFKPINVLVSGTYDITLKQKGEAKGTYDKASGKIELKDSVFTMTLKSYGVVDLAFPAFVLTTDTVNIDNKAGNAALSSKGSSLSGSGELTLVGGFPVQSGTILDQSSLKDGTILIVLKGKLDKVPDLSTCGSSTGGGEDGFSFKEVTKVTTTKDGKPVETETEDELSSGNVLDFGYVFVPEIGQDDKNADGTSKTIPVTDKRYLKKKTLRIKNLGSKDQTLTINSTADFTITPNGPVTIPAAAPNNYKDFEITFGSVTPIAYPAGMPDSDPKTMSINANGVTATIKGNARKGAAEIEIVGRDQNLVSDSLDFGVSPALIEGVGSDTRLFCKRIPSSVRRVTVRNIGVRTLNGFSFTTVNDQAQTAECPGTNREFSGVINSVNDYVSCQDDSGKAITPCIREKAVVCQDDAGRPVTPCQLPGGKGSIDLDIIYRPVNASSVDPTKKDTGTLTLTYGQTKTVKLSGGIFADRSGLVKIRVLPTPYELNSGGNLLVSIPKDANEGSSEFELLNNFDRPFEIKEVKLDGEGKEQFEITGLTVSDQIPGRVGTVRGSKKFSIKLKSRPADGKTLVLPLKISYSEVGSTGTGSNSLDMQVIGSYDYKALSGFMKFNIKLFFAHVGTKDVKTIESIDSRKPEVAKEHGPGPLLLKFTPVIDKDGKEHPYLREVTVGYPKLASGDKLFDAQGKLKPPVEISKIIRGLSKQDRRRLVQVYTTKLSSFGPGGEFPTPEALQKGIPNCKVPEAMNVPFDSKKEGECAFFFFMIQGGTGFYNGLTGELTLSDLDMYSLLPYHNQLAEYGATKEDLTNVTSMRGKSTYTTRVIDNLTFPKEEYPEIWKGSGDIPLVPLEDISSSEVAFNDSDAVNDVVNFRACPGGDEWRPWLNDVFPALSCYVTNASPYYMKGYPVTPRPDGNYMSFAVTVRFATKATAPEGNVPFFMENGIMRAILHGKLEKCSDLNDPKGWDVPGCYDDQPLVPKL